VRGEDRAVQVRLIRLSRRAWSLDQRSRSTGALDQVDQRIAQYWGAGSGGSEDRAAVGRWIRIAELLIEDGRTGARITGPRIGANPKHTAGVTDRLGLWTGLAGLEDVYLWDKESPVCFMRRHTVAGRHRG
jgi:hypothetical protein